MPTAKDPRNTVAPKRRPTQSCQFKGRPGGAPALTSIEDGATAMVVPPDNAAFAVREILAGIKVVLREPPEMCRGFRWLLTNVGEPIFEGINAALHGS